MMKEWKRKQEEKEKEGSASNAIIDKMREANARARAQEIEESGNSSSLSAQKASQLKGGNVEESYTTDEFEESVSVSGSGPKKFERLFQGSSAAKRAEASKVTA